MDAFKLYLAKVATGARLSADEARAAFGRHACRAKSRPRRWAAFLMALRVRGETVEEITGAVTAMRAKMLKVRAAPDDAIDIVGTGGDGHGSHVSTVSALIGGLRCMWPSTAIALPPRAPARATS